MKLELILFIGAFRHIIGLDSSSPDVFFLLAFLLEFFEFLLLKNLELSPALSGIGRKF